MTFRSSLSFIFLGQHLRYVSQIVPSGKPPLISNKCFRARQDFVQIIQCKDAFAKDLESEEPRPMRTASVKLSVFHIDRHPKKKRLMLVIVHLYLTPCSYGRLDWSTELNLLCTGHYGQFANLKTPKTDGTNIIWAKNQREVRT